MTKINTENWKEFVVGDLFDIVKPAVYHLRQVTEDDNGTPYIVRTKFNNGVKVNVLKTEDMELNPKGVITFGAENPAFFYQEDEFISGRDMYYIDTRSISQLTCLFLITCLTPIANKYSYNFGLFPSNLNKESIILPTTQEGLPDWEYMERYMRTVLTHSANKLDALLTTG